MTETSKWVYVSDLDKCQFEGPYECPSCGGHIIFDSTYLEQVDISIACPYCGTMSSVPEEDDDIPPDITIKLRTVT